MTTISTAARPALDPEETPGPADDFTVAERDDLVRLVFDGAYESVHADIRAVLLDPVFDPRSGLTMDQAGHLAYERCRVVHGHLERPVEILADPRRLFALAQWPSLVDVSVFSLLMVHYNLCLGTVVDHGGGRPDVADHVDELDRLASFGPYMATELGYGNNVSALRTRAVYDRGSDTFVIDTPDDLARKHMSYSGFSDVPKLAVVMARVSVDGTDHGIFPFVVRIGDGDGPAEGVQAVPCPEKPVQGLDNGLTRFVGVRVPRRNLLLGDMGEFAADGSFRTTGGNARKRFLRAMSRILPGRLCVASAAVGAGQAAVYIALRYAQHRMTGAAAGTDRPVLAYRSHQRALVTALSSVYAVTFLANETKRAYVGPGSPVDAELGTRISITKALATWTATDVVAVCRERCGAQGIFSVNRIADYGSLLQGLVTAEGDNQVLMSTVAGQLLALLAREPEPALPAAVPSGGPGAVGELDPVALLGLLGYREAALRRQIRADMDDETNPRSYFDAWNDNLTAALAMARLRGVRLALEAFLRAADGAGTERGRSALRRLAAVYAATEVSAEAGWYLARGLLSAGLVENLPARIDRLCAGLVPDLPLLIEGFMLTPELLRAPIAEADYAAAFVRRSRELQEMQAPRS